MWRQLRCPLPASPTGFVDAVGATEAAGTYPCSCSDAVGLLLGRAWAATRWPGRAAASDTFGRTSALQAAASGDTVNMYHCMHDRTLHNTKDGVLELDARGRGCSNTAKHDCSSVHIHKDFCICLVLVLTQRKHQTSPCLTRGCASSRVALIKMVQTQAHLRFRCYCVSCVLQQSSVVAA
jgi:hypothetical protein